jgi:pimeloyl-ACP methyl ester carboxylesterase
MKLKTLALAFALISSCVAKTNENSFVEKEINFTRGGVTISGTFSAPDTIKSRPCIVMVTGSGPQNRDEDIMGFKIFKIIAEYLNKEGYAVYRYDDRGVAKSKTSKEIMINSSVLDFSQDALNAVREIKKQKGVDTNKVGVFGHSEGGAVAEILAGEYPKEISFVILMAGPTIPGSVISDFQIKEANSAAGISGENIQEILKYQHLMYDAVKNGKSNDDIYQILYDVSLKSIDFLPPEQKASITNKEEFAKAQAKNGARQVCSPWFKQYISVDPLAYLKKSDCKILAIFGEKDKQVPVELNLDPLNSAFKGNSKLTCVTIKDANHLFQKAETGSFNEYSSLKKEFAPNFLETITNWLKLNVK